MVTSHVTGNDQCGSLQLYIEISYGDTCKAKIKFPNTTSQVIILLRIHLVHVRHAGLIREGRANMFWRSFGEQMHTLWVSQTVFAKF